MAETDHPTDWVWPPPDDVDPARVDEPGHGFASDPDPMDPLAPEELVALDALDTELDRLAQVTAPTRAPGAPPREDGTHPAYRETHRPVVRAQLNPRHRRHPEWPEEWYARVPGTRLSWSPRDAAALGIAPRDLETPAFPTAAAAEAAAIARWRERWQGQVRADAWILVRREQVFTVDVSQPADLAALDAWRATLPDGVLPDGVLVHYKHAPIPAQSTTVASVPLEDPLDAVRMTWTPRDVPERGARRSPAPAPEPAAVELARRRAWAAESGAAPAAAPPGPWYVVALAPEIWTLFQPGDPIRFWQTPSGRPVRIRAATAEAAAAAVAPAGATIQPAPPHMDAEVIRQAWVEADRRVTAARWVAAGRTLLQEARGLAAAGPAASRSAVRALYAAATRAVRAVVQPDGALVPHPDAATLLPALHTVILQATAMSPALADRARQWVADAAVWHPAARGIAAPGADRIPPTAGEEPDLGWDPLAADLGRVAQAERREVFACPLPSGRFLLWGADPGLDDTTRRMLPEAYQPSLQSVPSPRWVDRRLYPSWDAVKAAAADRDATVTVLARPEVVGQWLRAVARTHDRAQFRALFRTAFKGPPGLARRAPPPARAAAVPDRTPQATPEPVWHVAPWGPGRAVLWGRLPAGHPVLAAVGPEGQLVPAAPGHTPAVLQQPGAAFGQLLHAAQQRWPGCTPADLPEPLADAVARGAALGAPATPGVRDVIWHVVPHPSRPEAYAWAYTLVDRPDGFRRQSGALARRNQIVRFSGPTAAAAVEQALTTLARQDAVGVPQWDRATPRAVADLVFGTLPTAQTARTRVPDPFTVFASLRADLKAVALTAVPEPVRTVVVPAAFGVLPRELARAWNQPLDAIQRAYRQAEQALAAWLTTQPTLPFTPRPRLGV